MSLAEDTPGTCGLLTAPAQAPGLPVGAVGPDLLPLGLEMLLAKGTLLEDGVLAPSAQTRLRTDLLLGLLLCTFATHVHLTPPQDIETRGA